MKRLFTYVALTLSLAACGFTPMLADRGDDGGVTSDFSRVEVASAQDRLSQLVRNALLDDLNPYGESTAPQYHLDLVLSEETEGFGFRSDESVTRINYRLEASYRLIDLADGALLTEGTVRSNMAYDVVTSDFANFSADQDARQRTANQIASIIVNRLGLYFRSENSTP